jgi:protein-disulfide isomerase
MAAGCKAQTATPPAADPALNRHIEVMVRSQYNVPQDFDVKIGERKVSQIPGYDSLPVIIQHGGQASSVEFLLSKDNKTLARLETFDLAKDPALNIDVTGRAIRGNPGAKITVINYDDLQCPYCAHMHQALFPATLDRYKDKVRFVYKDFPLVQIHPWAMHAAVDANCLAAQSSDVYWTYVDYIHSHGQEVNGEDRNTSKSFDALNRIARDEATVAKLDTAKLDACIQQQDDSKVKASMREGQSLGVEGTPALFIDGERISGAIPQEQIWLSIDRALRAAGIDPPAPPAPPVQAGAAATTAPGAAAQAAAPAANGGK